MHYGIQAIIMLVIANAILWCLPMLQTPQGKLLALVLAGVYAVIGFGIAIDGAARERRIAQAGQRPCQCGSGEPWVSCSKGSSYCG